MRRAPAPTSALARCLQRAAAAAGIGAAPDLTGRLLAYLELLEQWNRTVRLTGERSPARVAEYLVAPCLAAAPHVRGTHCADLGSGAGLPGLVLAMALPDTRWTLIDSNFRKTCFLRQACIELALTNVEVAHARIEAYPLGQGFDTLVARALGRLPELVALARPLAAPGARLLAWKGPAVSAELAALGRMGTAHRTYPLPPANRHYRLVEVFLAAPAFCDNSQVPLSGRTHCPGSSQ